MDMIRNYIKIAWRNLYKYIGYTAIKISGLSLGICCCILIMLFVGSEWSYDKFHSKADRIYRVWQDEKYEDQQFVNTVTPLVMGPTMQNNIPEFESFCRVVALSQMVTLNGNDFDEQILMVDDSFFEVFDFPIYQGNDKNPLSNKSEFVLSESIAKKYFGNQNPVGQNLELLLGDEKILFTVSALAKDSPEASSIKFNMLIPYSNADALFSKGLQNSWFNVMAETYVVVKENSSMSKITSKFPPMMKQALGEDYTPGGFELYLQPITEIHLDNSLPQGNQPISDPKYSYILACIGILILLVACANFILLAIGQSSDRAREIGVRKVMGAERYHLVRQFLGEAFLVTTVSFLLALGLSYLLLGPFNTIIQRELTLPFNLNAVFFCLLLIVIIASIAGFYPAMILSKFNPVKVLKGGNFNGGGSTGFRKGLIVGQFAISIAMIICTIIISQQINYFKNKDLGYNKDQVIIVSTNLNRKDGNIVATRFKNELLKNSNVLGATVSLFSFAENSWVNLGFTNERDEYKNFQYNSIDTDYIETMDVQLAEGRNFNKANASDPDNAAIVNETFVDEFGLENPVGKKLPGNFDHRIVGVVKDFNFQSLHTSVSPLLLTMKPDSIFRKSENIGIQYSPEPRISVRMKGANPQENLDLLKRVWYEVAPNQDFESAFLDDTVLAQYRAEIRTSTLVKIASILSVIIACMGLFGLVTLMVAKRRKEIGIRKVLGAKVSSIIGLFSLDFAKLVVGAALLAAPLAWWFMSNWLKDFEYRIEIKWWVFVVASMVAIVIALVTIGFQALKAARANPTKSLRAE